MFAKLREWVDRRLSNGAAPTEPARSEFGVDAEYGRQVRARADALELAVEVEMARSRQAM